MNVLTLLKNGLIYNGSVSKPVLGDIIIEDDKIVKITEEPVKDYKGEIIDCSGLCIAPGFIDAHSHNDFYTTMDDNLKYFTPFVEQGITSMVTGNCGFSPAGYVKNSNYKEMVGGGLFKVYPAGADYSSIKDWMEASKDRAPVNIFPLVGHGTARIGVNGKKSNKLSDRDMELMLGSIEKNLIDGAYGVSLGLMYEPGLYAPYEELLEVAKLVKKYDRVLTVHNRAQSKVSTSYNPPVGGRAHNLRAIDEMVKIARTTGVKLQNSHLIFVGSNTFSTVDETIKLIDDCNNEGLDFGFDIYSLTYGASIITVILPGWYLKLSPDRRKSLPVKIRLWAEIFVARKTLGLDFSDIKIANGAGLIDEFEGMYINEIAEKLNMSPYQAYIYLVDKCNGTADIYIKKYSSDEIVRRLVKHDRALLMTDAWYQPKGVQNGAAFYGMVKFLLMAKEGGICLESIINKITQKTAERFNIKNRGFLKEGNFADITIFDYDKLSYNENSISKPEGIKYVFINGRKVVSEYETNADILKKSGIIGTCK